VRIRLAMSLLVLLLLVAGHRLERQLPRPWLAPVAWSRALLDRDGGLLRLRTTADGYWRLPVDPARLDQRFVAALIRIEDRRFYRHDGVDPLALMRASWQWLTHGRPLSGASTISMQTVRLLTPRSRTLGNKLFEMLQALRMEADLDKQQILARYLALAPYGGNIQGVVAASSFYLGKTPERLSWSEIALLLALPQSPEQRRPDRHAPAARQARARILQRLSDAGLLDAQAVLLANRQAVPRRRQPTPAVAPHLADRLLSRSSAQRVKSSLDAGVQAVLEQLARAARRELPADADLAIVVLNRDSQALGYLGSADYWRRPLDLVQAHRSPGSTLKPLIYGMAFESGIAHPQTRVWDRAEWIDGYLPRNYADRYHGEVTLGYALQHSLNVPAVKLLREVGPLRLLQRLASLTIDYRLPAHAGAGLPLALGGLALSLEDLVNLYAALARQGRYLPLGFCDAPAPMETERRLLSAEASAQIGDILAGVPLPASSAALPRVRFKTGTSFGFRDSWAIGYDDRYAAGVWVGRADGGSMQSGSGLERAAPLLLRLFNLLPDSDRHFPPSLLIGADRSPLPESLRWLPGEGPRDRARPRILFPLDGSELTAGRELVLQRRGGRGPFSWLINGEPVATADFRQRLQWRPDTAGQVEILLLDSLGESDRVAVWLQPR
jgi:penicillin-binding protein 1C